MGESQWAVLLCGVWVVWHVLVVLLFRQSKHLSEYSAAAAPDAPLVSVVVPARNEARNIERCVRALLGSSYPRFEVIVVDDHSTDGTGELVRAIAAQDAAARVRVVEAPALPEGWFGKQWACQTGASAARGDLLLFTDADTAHGPELLSRSVNAMRVRGAAMFTVAGRQEMETFWEKVVQPFVFAVLLGRFGSLERMSRSTTPRNKIANGQFLLFTRAAYDAVGQHAAVKSHVAEDLMLAQRCTVMGLPMHMVLGQEHLSTRMYTSLGEIRRGWGKNVYAAGRDTMPPWLYAVARYVYPLPAVVTLLPTVLVVLALLNDASAPVLTAAWIAQGVTALFWVGVYSFSGLSPLWALSYPLGAAVFGWILGEAAWRGDKVEWKGRRYVSKS